MNKAEAKREVARLVSKLDSLTKPEFKKYDEENTKKDFILPLFRALGWAIEDRREVTAEDKVSRRRVDYAFRIEGIPKFFLEAKPLKADLDNPEYAWQAINYAWTKGVTWAVLTDFEGLKVFNAQWKGPSLLYNRFIDIPYTEYLERFDELWLLSRECFEKGLLDIEAEKVAKKAKREPVGKQLFDDLIVWRQRLYRQLRGWEENKKYSEAQIDEAVQRILDRLIFIRTAEDRELEERLLLPAVREWRENGRREELDKALARIFRDFDKKYDSELFEGHFCEDLVCDSTTYARVIERLYGMRDEVPTYNFDAIDVDVLGGIYEQYLSYRQGLPEEVEEAKRRRRKKRGIYYTPKFVVQYIVENTVGRLLQERSHDEIRKLRILDPACGSGSFLIEAFDCLDRYHQEARGTAQRSDEKAARDDFLERLRILRDNIYGVDLDPQAVEIARLNLLLKTLYQRALLPKLEDNIRCGNSLISGLPIELSRYFGPDWEAKRPFNWEEEFPNIMEEGGFDVVIGNPPYVSAYHMPPEDRRYFSRSGHFVTPHKKYDIYILFIERAIDLLKHGGRMGFIVSYPVLSQTYAEKLRRFVLDKCSIEAIVDLSEYKVFDQATVATCILILRKEDNPTMRASQAVQVVRKVNGSPEIDTDVDVAYIIPQVTFETTPQNMFRLALTPEVREIIEKITKRGVKMHRLCYVSKGLVSHSEVERKGKDAYIHDSKIDPTCVKYVEGKEISRYQIDWMGRYIQYLPHILYRPTFPELHESPKIVVRSITGDRGLMATYDQEEFYVDHNVDCCIPWATYYSAKPARRRGGPEEPVDQYSLLYLLGLINSRVLNFWFRVMFGFELYVYPENVRQLPIRRIDFDNRQDVKMHDDLVALVERMLDLHKRLKEAKGEEEKNLERQIVRTDGQIDDLVYQLYGITEKERKIIEGKAGRTQNDQAT